MRVFSLRPESDLRAALALLLSILLNAALITAISYAIELTSDENYLVSSWIMFPYAVFFGTMFGLPVAFAVYFVLKKLGWINLRVTVLAGAVVTAVAGCAIVNAVDGRGLSEMALLISAIQYFIIGAANGWVVWRVYSGSWRSAPNLTSPG